MRAETERDLVGVASLLWNVRRGGLRSAAGRRFIAALHAEIDIAPPRWSTRGLPQGLSRYSHACAAWILSGVSPEERFAAVGAAFRIGGEKAVRELVRMGPRNGE